MSIIIDPALAKISEKSQIIFNVKFTAYKDSEYHDLFQEIQDIMYEGMGTSGYCRMSPLNKCDLNEKFIQSPNKDESLFYPYTEKEFYVSFLIEVTDPDVPMYKELEYFSEELSEFCRLLKYSVEQQDIRTMYS